MSNTGSNMKIEYVITKNKITLLVLLATVVFFSCVGAPSFIANPLDELDVAIREASVYFSQRIPVGNNIAIVSIESEHPAISDYIINNLMDNLVNDGYFTVVDRHQLDAIREELQFQLSGDVDDNTAQSIGRMVGAQTIILGSFVEVANTHRLLIRALEVETAVVRGLFSQNVNGNVVIEAFTGMTATLGIGTRTGLFANGEYQGELNLFDAVNWINRNAVNRGDYIIVIGHDEVIPPILLSPRNRSINVTLRSNGSECRITYDKPSRPSASLFTIGTGVTFILEDGIILVGLPIDSLPLVRINGGIFIMNGGIIRDNSLSVYLTNRSSHGFSWSEVERYGGGVHIETGSFVMNNGTIEGNSSYEGGGVFIGENTTFLMNGGVINNNNAYEFGGGVYSLGSFIMRGGTISGNSANSEYNQNGGGVCIGGHLFIMENGVISGNSGDTGGGISIIGGNFTMRGGIIAGNIGVGVFCRISTRFIKTGGIIYGSDAPNGLANRNGAALNWGNMEFVVIRTTTAGEDVSMDNFFGEYNFTSYGWEEFYPY